jgi:LysM repeat protein
MRLLRSIAMGLGIAILSTSIVLGSLSLAMLERKMTGNFPTLIEPSWTIVTPSLEPSNTEKPITAAPPTITATLPPTPAVCPPPAGWVPITVQLNEDLEIYSKRYKSSIDLLSQANCLTSASLTVGAILYVPPLPTATLIPCGPPAGWIIYVVKPKDNLFQISRLYQTSVPLLQAANCMGSSTLIIAGQPLYVPNVATITPTRTTTPTVTPLLTLSITSTTVNFSAPGVTINLNYKLKNTGKVTISGPFTVVDTKLSVSCPVTTSLAPNAEINCSATYSSTQNDVDAGSFAVSATGHAFYNGNAIASNQATASIPATQNSSLTLDKTSLMSSYVLVGDLLNYTYNLMNTGNVTLSGPFTVSDDKTPVACPATSSLAPNASINCTATYSVTQTDVDNGSVTNTATGHASFKGNPVNSNPDSLTINSTIPVGMLQENNNFIARSDPAFNTKTIWIFKTMLST